MSLSFSAIHWRQRAAVLLLATLPLTPVYADDDGDDDKHGDDHGSHYSQCTPGPPLAPHPVSRPAPTA